MSEGTLTDLSVFPVQDRADHAISGKVAQILHTSGQENLSFVFFYQGHIKAFIWHPTEDTPINDCNLFIQNFCQGRSL
jgi:hypothetical protein